MGLRANQKIEKKMSLNLRTQQQKLSRVRKKLIINAKKKKMKRAPLSHE